MFLKKTCSQRTHSWVCFKLMYIEKTDTSCKRKLKTYHMGFHHKSHLLDKNTHNLLNMSCFILWTVYSTDNFFSYLHIEAVVVYSRSLFVPLTDISYAWIIYWFISVILLVSWPLTFIVSEYTQVCVVTHQCWSLGGWTQWSLRQLYCHGNGLHS